MSEEVAKIPEEVMVIEAAVNNDIEESIPCNPTTTSSEEPIIPATEPEEDPFWNDKLNLVGHCAICMGNGSGGGRRDVEVMNHLWSYLRDDWKEEYVSKFMFVVEKGRNKDVAESKVPPLCSMCRDSLKILDKLHEDLISIQTKIDTQVRAIRRMMQSGKLEKGFQKFARDAKKANLPFLCLSNTLEFLSRLHGRSCEELHALVSSASAEPVPSEGDNGEENTSGQRRKNVDPLQDAEVSFNDFFDDSSESRMLLDSLGLSPDEDDTNNASDDDETGSNTVPPIKAEPQSDHDADFDPNDYLEMDESDPEGSQLKRSSSSHISKPCPRSVKEKLKKRTLSETDKARPKSKARKRIKDLGSSGSESEGFSRNMKIKKEIQSGEDELDSDEEESGSDSEWEKPARKKPRPSSNKGKSGSGTSRAAQNDEFKYKTHSRKKCEVCMEKLPLSVLFEHLKTHVKDYACKCKNCGQSFMSKHRLEVYHYQKWPKCRMAAGFPPPPWSKKCEACDFSSDSHVTLRSHLQKHEVPTEKSFTCPFRNCGESFCLRQNVEFHLEKHYNQGSSSAASQRCPVCAKCIEYDAQVDMKTHLKKSHKLKEVFPCKGCPHVYHDREALMRHIFPKHQKQGIHCDVCTNDDVKYFKENQLREHYFNTHSIGSKHYCDIQGCDYVGFCPRQLQKHRWYKHKNGEISTPLKIFKCEICTDAVYEYKSKDALTSHNIKVHGAEPFKCKICGESFETKNRWWRHERLHLGPIEPRYKCEYCQKQFNIANKLKDHVDRVHLKVFVNTFKCDQCDKSYSDICGLRYHKSAVHLGIKYTCDECGQSFAAPGALKTHQRRHTGERPYKCHLCTNTFRQPDAYKRHLFCHETLGEKFKPKKTNDRKFKKDNNETAAATVPPAAPGPSVQLQNN